MPVIFNLFYMSTFLSRICFGAHCYEEFSFELRNRDNCKQQNLKTQLHVICFMQNLSLLTGNTIFLGPLANLAFTVSVLRAK